MKTYICRCRQCRYVRQHDSGRKSRRYADIKGKKHGLRSKVRVNLRLGKWDDLPEAITADYFS